MMIRTGVIFFLLATGLSAGLRAECQAEVAKSLIAADKTFGEDADERGVDGWVTHFDSDARLLGPEDREIVGLAQVTAFYRRVFGKPEDLPKWTPLYADCSDDRTLGYTYGTWKSRTDEKAGGQYVTVWKKQKDGGWKVAFDLGNKR